MIASPCSGYHDVTFTICHSDGTCTTQSGPIYVTVTSDADLAELLAVAEAKIREIGDDQYALEKAEACERVDIDRPSPRPVTIFHPKGSRRPKPTQLPSTFG